MSESGRVACCEDGAQRTSVMHDVPCHFLHQILERDLCELGWKDILDQVRITFSDSVTRAQYWHLHLRATISGRHRVAVGRGGHVAVLRMTPRTPRGDFQVKWVKEGVTVDADIRSRGSNR